MKKNKVLYTVVAIFFAIDALLGWWVASYYFPKFALPEDQSTVVDRIVVEKAIRKMTLFVKNNIVAVYDIGLGFNPIGDKEEQGDGKTPEGRYAIVAKNHKSKYHLSLKISYPDKQDVLNARKKQLNPGGDIMIHGYPNAIPVWLGDLILKGKDWTQGCIAVTNEEIEKIWSYTRVGTVIDILP
ncbi:MAG: L,D-transpeptidase family protein [Alphaproteobacteria bacterium]|nr:L,D-transpeptidase family protein [Alphaproteobacteria bacterium]